MGDPLEARFAVANAELAAIEAGRTIPGEPGPAELEGRLLEELDEIEYEAGVLYFAAGQRRCQEPFIDRQRVVERACRAPVGFGVHPTIRSHSIGGVNHVGIWSESFYVAAFGKYATHAIRFVQRA